MSERRPGNAAFRDVTLALEQVQGLSLRERDLMLRNMPMPACPTFTWPEFDRWQAFFAGQRTYPTRWEGLEAVPPADTPASEVYRRRKLDLLREWLEAIGQRSDTVARYARQGLEARIAGQDVNAACAVCAPLIMHGARAPEDALPPFHPGCRCLLLAVHRATVPQRRRPHRRTWAAAS